MMSVDYTGFRFPKGQTRARLDKAQQNAEAREWDRTKAKVDARDGRRCQVTGVILSPGAVDPWKALERHHLEYRSKNKLRRWTAYNVWTVSLGVHRLIHDKKLRILNKAGHLAIDVREIDHVAWDRRRVAIGEEPIQVRPGLAVRKDAN